MKLNYSVLATILFLVLMGSTSLVVGAGVTIIIDGDFSDWNGLEPVFTEEEIHPDYWLDIQQAFIAANETMLFVRVDYAAPLDYWASLMTNITLRTPTNEVFVLLFQIVYETEPHWSFSTIFPGRSLSSFLNDPENLSYIAEYESSGAIDLATNRTVEYYYRLDDLGLQLNDSVDLTFWHYENVSAGEYYVPLHKYAGTVFKVLLNGTASSYHPSSITTTTTNIASVSVLGLITGISIISLRKRKKEY